MFEKTSECTDAFQKLKDVLTKEIVMTYPKYTGILILDTDASGTGIRVTLSQMQYCHRSLTEEKKAYCAC